MIKIIYSTILVVSGKAVSAVFNVENNFEINYNLGVENKKYMITYLIIS